MSAEGEGGPDAGGPEREFDHRQLDRTIHSRIRLAVLSVLAAVENARFTYLRDQVNTTDGNLSTHLKKLEEAGYVGVEKSFEDRKPVTRYHLTDEGRRAFREYVESLGEMLGLEGEAP
ncbi:MAG: winged helix-turn-helix domain-containing protein [Gemmatimonadota bacterium]